MSPDSSSVIPIDWASALGQPVWDDKKPSPAWHPACQHVVCVCGGSGGGMGAGSGGAKVGMGLGGGWVGKRHGEGVNAGMGGWREAQLIIELPHGRCKSTQIPKGTRIESPR